MTFVPLNSAQPTQNTSGFVPISSPTTQSNPSIADKIWSTISSVGTGAVKGVASTANSMNVLGNSAADNTLGRVINAANNKGFTPTDSAKPFIDLQSSPDLNPQSPAESVGFAGEKLAEFLLPSMQAAKAEQTINILTQGIKSPLLASLARIGGKAAVQGVSAGAVNLLQTADPKQAATTAAAAAGTRGAFATIGEGARALNLPERLYSTIFKTTSNDMMQELRTEALSSMEKSNPEKFKSLIDAGIIKPSAGGTYQVDESLAKQALDAGLKGSIRNMAHTVVGNTLESEQKVHNIASSYSGTLDLSEKQFKNVLTGIAQRYEDVGFGEISDEAKRLAGVLSSNNGQVSAIDALDIRRLLDKARIASSFDAPAEKLSLSQSNLKTLADTARKRINAIPGMGETMKEYSFNIDALETLAKEAARRQNNQAISLIDSLFLSGSFGANSPVPGMTAGMFRKYIMSGPGVTGVARLLNKSVVSPATSLATQAGAASLSSQIQGLQQ